VTARRTAPTTTWARSGPSRSTTRRGCASWSGRFDLLELVVERSRKFGLGDYRPAKGGDFGCFDAVLEQGDLHKLSSNGAALKPVDMVALKAHTVLVEQLMTQAPPV